MATVTTVGLGGAGACGGDWYWCSDGAPTMTAPATDKPPYRVPSMAEIAAIPDNGLRVVSTFSGCGGSCLGFKMAGYRVLWANEFIHAAREVYEANHPGVPVDGRTIREITGAEILAATGLVRGEIDVLEGSPPCASFSTAGKRERDWGKVKKYSDAAQRTDDLFFDFIRIVEDIQPRVFVAENVSGLVKGTAKGYFKRVLRAMKDAGYRVEARLLDAQWLGVPQARQRIIFVGVRNDLERSPVFPTPLPYRYSVRDALPWIAEIESQAGVRNHANWAVNVKVIPPVNDGPALDGYAVGREWDTIAPGEASDKYFQLVKPKLGEPCPTITQRGGDPSVASVTHPTERRKFTIAELRRICGFPDDFILTGTYAQQWERLGRAVPPPMMAAVAAAIRDHIFDGGRDAS